MKRTQRPLRADAARNRARVLEVAYEMFAAHGLAVSLDDIARRAGVGPGTLHRNFPAKDDLVRAVVLNRVQQVVDEGSALLEAGEPSEALFTFMRQFVLHWSATDRGLSEALEGSGASTHSVIPEAVQTLLGLIGQLLQLAQQAGAVRDDVSARDVKTLLAGCSSMYVAHPEAGPRLLEIVIDGLQAVGAEGCARSEAHL